MTVTELARVVDRSESYISKVEREELPPPGEWLIRRFAEIFQKEPETLLLMCNKLTVEALEILQKRPALFDELLKACKDLPDEDVREMAKKVRDGKW